MLEAIEQAAKVCHEANRAYCETLGDHSQPSWDNAPAWQKDSARDGVKFHFAHYEKLGTVGSPGASHLRWLEQKRAAGWTYGPVKDPAKKEHPCFVEYEKLPLDQRLKDYIFAAICKAFAESAESEEKH